ncbi:MAG: hypothetical protein ACKOQM_12455 [Novosphingobium sp.]
MTELMFGRELELYSPLRPDELRDRINGSTGSMFWPFQVHKIVGGISLGWMRLRYQSSPFEYNAKPVLSGRMQADLSGTRIRARFGASATTKLFFVFWYSVLAIIMVSLGAQPRMQPGQEPVPWPFILIFVILPAAMHLLLTRNASRDLERILRFLAEQGQITVV